MYIIIMQLDVHRLCVFVCLFFVTSGELFPLEYKLEAERQAKEEAVAAKVQVEKKAREFVTDQTNQIEKLTKEKVSFLSRPLLSITNYNISNLLHINNFTHSTIFGVFAVKNPQPIIRPK